MLGYVLDVSVCLFLFMITLKVLHRSFLIIMQIAPVQKNRDIIMLSF